MIRLVVFDWDGTLMVGDTEFDLAMAAAAAVPAAAVTYGAHERQRLLDLRPAIVIDALSELPARLASLAALIEVHG